MASFLSWLFGVANNVYLWFGSQFYALYAGASNAWTWATSQASAALAAAKNYAWGLLQGIEADLSGFEDWTNYQLGLLRTSITGFVSVTYAQVVGWINSSLTPLWTAISGFSAQIVNSVNNLSGQIVGWINQHVADAVNLINSSFSWVLSLRTQITNLVASLTPDRIAALVNLVNNDLAHIRQFLSDPITFIWDLLWTSFLDIAGWVIAMGMGSTETGFDQTPPWRR